MKINVKKKPVDVQLGDLVISGSGTSYLVAKNDSERFTLYDIRLCRMIAVDYPTIQSMVENYFKSYEHYPKDTLELISNGGSK